MSCGTLRKSGSESFRDAERMRSEQSETDARVTAVARASYSKLLAILSSRNGDIAGAEDALSAAFESALKTWAERGIPNSPEAWLLTAARNRQKDHYKSAREKTRVSVDDEQKTNVSESIFGGLSDEDISEFGDKRLELLFVCAHPAIDASIRTPLMLQTVLGMRAEEIAAAYLMPTSALAQRLVRAKRKIKAARIPFVVPEASAMKERLPSVLDAIYGVHSISWLSQDDQPLANEGLYLAELLCTLMPGEPEALGLFALLAFLKSRQRARVVEGCFVPLEKHDTSLWDSEWMEHGNRALHLALKKKVPGRYQLEAAIQAAHSERGQTDVDWKAVLALYEGLLKIAPSAGAMVGRAMAMSHVSGAEAGLKVLASVPKAHRVRFQSYEVARAHLQHRAGLKECTATMKRAISLTTDARLIVYLRSVLEGWESGLVSE